MKIAVKDANVFIDMESMGILDLWFQLGYETLTSDFVVTELEKGDHQQALSHVRAGQVGAISISGEQLPELYALFAEIEPAGASLEDASVLHIALAHDALLLTGDKALRTQSEVRMVECHGTFWILEQLVDEGLLLPQIAADKLVYLLGLTGRRKRFLPRALAESYIQKWRK